jgi:hypothetical protein
MKVIVERCTIHNGSESRRRFATGFLNLDIRRIELPEVFALQVIERQSNGAFPLTVEDE